MNKLIGIIVSSVMVLTAVFVPAVVHAQANDSKTAVCQGAGAVNNSLGCNPADGSPDANATLKKGINLFSAILGILSVIMMMVGGIKYITSQGDAAQVNSAKNTVLYSGVGIVIVALAQIIVKFVLDRFGQ